MPIPMLSEYSFDPQLAMSLGQKIGTALIILLVTWLVARAVKWAIVKIFARIPQLNRTTGNGETMGAALGKIASLLVWLFGLTAFLQAFQLGAVIMPVQTLLDDVMGFIPRLIGAGLIFFVGLTIARIVKQLVETALGAVSFDRWLGRAGASEVTGSSQFASTIGTVVFALIIIPVAIAALDALHIDAVSRPATEMLRMILTSLPRIVGAAIVLAIGVFIARWVAGLLQSVLPNLGVDRAIGSAGIAATVLPSRAIGVVAQTAIVLFAGIAATRMLEFPELSMILDQVLALGGHVIFGSIVIGAGVLLANVISKFIASSTGETGIVPAMIRYVIIAVATFMGLTFMQIGKEIVIIAFSGFVFAVSVASALAFGLGGREQAGLTLADLRVKAKAPTL